MLLRQAHGGESANFIVRPRIINILCADVYRSSTLFGCFVCYSVLLRCVVFSSILNCMFHCILFWYRNLFSFSLVYQFQSVQFCHTLFHLLSTFLSIKKCIPGICIFHSTFHFRKVVLRVKFQDWHLQRAYQDHLNINHMPIIKKIISCFVHRQQYLFILFYLDNMFRSIDHHQTILIKLRIRCM